MTDHPPGRPRLLGLLAMLPATARAARAFGAPAPGSTVAFSENPQLLVAGPADGLLNRWADALVPALEQALPPDTAIRRVAMGSADGVTAANQFEVRGVPDGMTVMLVPGEAALAWMVGDSRAQFDVGHWVPVMAGTTSAVLVCRTSLQSGKDTIRVAAAGPASPDLPALIGLQLLGMKIEPVFGLTDVDAGQRSIAQGAGDAVLLRGPHLAERLATYATLGARPLFTLGAIDDAGRLVRDPAFPDIPQFVEVYRSHHQGTPHGALYDAWRASAAAVRMEFGLVLPQLTPAAMVALWRRAAADAVASLKLQVISTALGVRLLAGPAAASNTTDIATNAATLGELRQWLTSRFNWRPA